MSWNPFIVEMMERISPLYHHLSQQMEQDPEIMALEALVQRHQPCPITFFAAVNALLLRDRRHPLAKYYPYLTDVPHPAHDAYPAFRHFCLTHQQELRAKLPTFRLQTNEVSRCANWLPALEIASRWLGGKPLHLIELGCSAGLNLLVDCYTYRYSSAVSPGHEVCIGNGTSLVEIHCQLTDLIPPIPVHMPSLAQRIGIDLFPLDVKNEVHVRTLLGAIWPEERERYDLLNAAIAFAQHHPLSSILQGDAATLLPEVIEAIPEDQPICIVHSYALRQDDPSLLPRVEQIVIEASKHHTIYRIALEIDQQEQWDAPRLEFCTYWGGQLLSHRWLATCEVHGNAMRWLEKPE